MLRIKYKDCPKWKQTLYELLACQQRSNKLCTNTFLQRTAPKSLPRKKNGFRGEKDSRPPLVCEGMWGQWSACNSIKCGRAGSVWHRKPTNMVLFAQIWPFWHKYVLCWHNYVIFWHKCDLLKYKYGRMFVHKCGIVVSQHFNVFYTNRTLVWQKYGRALFKNLVLSKLDKL